MSSTERIPDTDLLLPAAQARGLAAPWSHPRDREIIAIALYPNDAVALLVVL